MELTAPYTLEQNEIAERKNRMVVEMARNMLKSGHLLNKFRTEIVKTDVYLLNISPTKAVMVQTPFEAWRAENQRESFENFQFNYLCINKFSTPSKS